MSIICVADGDCTTWSRTIPASQNVGANLPFENIDPAANDTDYVVSNIPSLTFITVDDQGGGNYAILFEDPFQSGLISSPAGAPNNLAGALPDCLDGTDPNRIFFLDLTIASSTARQFNFRQAQCTVISSGVSGANGSFRVINVNTGAAFPPSPYPNLILAQLQAWVSEFGNAVQVGLANAISVTRAACSSTVSTNVAINSTGATTWNVTIEDPNQSNLVSDPSGSSNNVDGSVLDCLNSTDPDAILTFGFTVLGIPYQFSVPTSMVTAVVTTPNGDGANVVISIDTSLAFTTAALANTLQADLTLANGVTGFPTFTLLRCDGVNAAQEIQGAGTVDDPLIPNVVLHPDGSIECGPNGLRLTTSFTPSPQGPTSTPQSGGVAFPPQLNGCANWICDIGNDEWFAPEHRIFIVRGQDVRTLGLVPTFGPGSFVLGSLNNHILTFSLSNGTPRPLIPRIVIRVQSRILNPVGTASSMLVRSNVSESWTGNVYRQDTALAATMFDPFGGTQIEDERSTTFILSTVGGIYTPNLGGYQAIPPGGTVTYNVNVGHQWSGATPALWTRNAIVAEAALFTST